MTTATGPDMGRALGLPSPLFRHAVLLLLGVGAVLLPSLVLGQSITAQTATWLVTAAVAGVVGGLIGRSWLGLVFVIAGIGLGVGLLLALRLGLTAATQDHLAEHGLEYIALLPTALVGYVLITAGPRLLRRG